ncbi:M3B_PepF domain containing protein [Sphingomonadaceae bacterium]
MKSGTGKKIEITQERFENYLESERELRKLKSELDGSAGSKKFGAFVFYCLTIWGVSLDEGRFAMVFAILGPVWLYVVSLLPRISDSESFVKFSVFCAFISIIIIGVFGARLDPNGSSETYFYTFAFSAIGTGFLPLKKSQTWKN